MECNQTKTSQAKPSRIKLFDRFSLFLSDFFIHTNLQYPFGGQATYVHCHGIETHKQYHLTKALTHLNMQRINVSSCLYKLSYSYNHFLCDFFVSIKNKIELVSYTTVMWSSRFVSLSVLTVWKCLCFAWLVCTRCTKNQRPKTCLQQVI